MAFENPLQVITREASTDLSGNQYYAIKLDTNGRAALAGAADSPIGVLQNKPDALGKAAAVMTYGISRAVYGGEVTAGYRVRADAAGKIVESGAGEPVLGVALEAGSADEIHAVLLAQAGGPGASRCIWSHHVNLADITADGDVVTEWIPGFAGTIEKVSWIQGTPVTTADDLATLNLEIEAVDLTGGVVSLTSAACTPLGKVIDGTAVTAANVFTALQKISVEASAVTPFAEGDGTLVVVIRIT